MARLRTGTSLVALGVISACTMSRASQTPSADERAESPTRDVQSAGGQGSQDAEAPVVDVEINAHYAEKNVEGWVERFEREGREVHDRRDEILQALRLEVGMRVADLGAGTGLFTFPIARAVGPKGRVFAVDVQPQFLAHLEQRAADEGLSHVSVVAADQRSPNLPAGSVDVAFFCDAYHHVEYPRTYLAHVREAIAPGGRLVVVDYARIEGKSPAWLLSHVRASPEVFRREIEDAGFVFVGSQTFLQDNFFFEFERPAQ